MSGTTAWFRAPVKAKYAHNYHLIFTTRGRLELFGPEQAQCLVEHFREIDNYGLDKIRGVAIVGDQVHILVAIPPNRSVAQVAQRLKWHAANRLNVELPGPGGEKGFSWQRGYTARALGSQGISELKGYLDKEVAGGYLERDLNDE